MKDQSQGPEDVMDFDFSKEQRDIAKAAREFAEKEFADRAEEFDRDETFDEAIFKKAAELGFVGIFIDDTYGGPGFGMTEQCVLHEEFSAVDMGIGVAVTSGAFGAEAIQMFGTEEQKQKHLPSVAAGETIMGSAFTEPDAGSDLAAVSTLAVRDGDEWVINGSKMFITNGCRADLLVCLVVTDPDDPKRHNRHSIVLVETDRPGFEANKLHGKLGIRASDTSEVSLTNVRVPYSNLLGERGKGFAIATSCFNLNRIGIAAQALGLMRASLAESIKHTKKRSVFGAPLSTYQATHLKLADMYTSIRAARSMIYEAAWRIDNGKTDHALVAAAKAFCGQNAVRCADMALQLQGGYGYFADSKVNRIYRDAKITEIYEGTTEIEKMIVAKSILA
jgi:alkylation response protein AidB-like acyl-CoA dehydrogenase